VEDKKKQKNLGFKCYHSGTNLYVEDPHWCILTSSLQASLGRMESVIGSSLTRVGRGSPLLVCRWQQWVWSGFFKWSCFPFQSRQGPVGSPHAKHACHWICGRRRYSWFCPVGNCCLCSWRELREFAGYGCCCRVGDAGHCSMDGAWTTVTLGCLLLCQVL